MSEKQQVLTGQGDERTAVQEGVENAGDAPSYNILKTRDDRAPLHFTAASENGGFVIHPSHGCGWADETFTAKDLRQRIEPWLSALFQSEHLSLLVGTGLTHAVHDLAAGTRAAGMERCSFSKEQDTIQAAADVSAKRTGRTTANIEDDLRAANELLRGLAVLYSNKDDTDARVEGLAREIAEHLQIFADAILQNETNIAAADETKRVAAFNTLVRFLMSFASRTATRDRLGIFTTNYDRILEAGAEQAGLHLMDRFVGNLAPIFRSSRLDLDMHYNPPGIRGEPRYLEGVARYTKLHGSIDWVQAGRDIRRIGLSFGADCIAPYLEAPGLEGATAHELMIYPNSAKDRETAGYPYVELFRDLASALCRPNSTLVTYGYSFGDEHINRVIEDMLTIPSTHLVVISWSDPIGRILQTYKKLGRSAQITLLVGPDLGDLKKLTDQYLPKPAIDRATVRMSDLLKVRYGTRPPANEGTQDTDEETP